ncbi:MAG: septum formation initiator family protein [Deltaproteobacteria bacterium]
MKNKRKDNLKKVVYSVVIVYVGYIVLKQQAILFDCQKQQTFYLNEIKKNQNISQELKQKKELYNSDFYVEKVAREKLGMVYPEEKVFKDISR